MGLEISNLTLIFEAPKKNIMENKIEFYYRAKGRVHGNCWDGCTGSYPSKEISSSSIEDLRRKIKEGIENGSLEEGFGFRSLFAAVMEMTTIRSVVIEDRTYRNEESVIEVFGKPNSNFIDADIEIIGI